MKITQLDVIDEYMQFREGDGLTSSQYEILSIPELNKKLNSFAVYDCLDFANDIIGEGFEYSVEQYLDVGCIEVEEDEIIIKPDKLYIPTDLDDCERDCIITLMEDEDRKKRKLPIKVYKFEKIETIDGEEFSIYKR